MIKIVNIIKTTFRTTCSFISNVFISNVLSRQQAEFQIITSKFK